MTAAPVPAPLQRRPCPAPLTAVSSLLLLLPLVLAPLLSLLLLSASPLLPRPPPPLRLLRAYRQHHHQQRPPRSPRATVLTLSYRHPAEDRNIAHNCRILSDAGHRFVVYTDRPRTASFCTRCRCEPFVPANCPCPAAAALPQPPNATGRTSHNTDTSTTDPCARRNPCEKLYFVAAALRAYGEFILLDDDVVVLRRAFAARLWARGAHHDFLATYGHAAMGAGLVARRHRLNFNSGLLFIRRLPRLDYGRMRRLMYTMRSMSDQGVISEFVHREYRNWDSLSLRWHCRMLSKLALDIPYEQCYTVHDRQDVGPVPKRLNMTLLTA